MTKYRQDLIEKVRNGEAQIQVDRDRKWESLLNHIFPKRSGGYNLTMFNYYAVKDRRYGYDCKNIPFKSPDLIIHAKDFLIQEPEINWVEVRNNFNQSWSRAIFIGDIGVQFKYRYFVVEPGKEEKFIGGESNLDVSAFKYMREIPVLEPLTHAEIEKLIGKPFKYVEG